MTTKTRRRPLDLDSLILAKGKHATPEEGFCIIEAVAWEAGEPFSDHPTCASPVIGEFLRAWNDAMNDTDRQMLKPLIPRLVGTAASDAVEQRRSWMALDWMIRVSAPAWLRLAKLESEAVALESCAEVWDAETARAAQGALDIAQRQAAATGEATRPATGEAVWATTREATREATRATTRATAGEAACAVARAAAWAAARAARAVARAATWEAAWVAAGEAREADREAMRPTVEHLQREAIALVIRMIEATK